MWLGLETLVDEVSGRTLCAKILQENHGWTLHIRVECPAACAVTMTGEVDGRNIAVGHPAEFYKYVQNYRQDHRGVKFNVIDLKYQGDGKFSERAKWDQKLQDEWDEEDDDPDSTRRRRRR